jgi:hypothetical protein
MQQGILSVLVYCALSQQGRLRFLSAAVGGR